MFESTQKYILNTFSRLFQSNSDSEPINNTSVSPHRHYVEPEPPLTPEEYHMEFGVENRNQDKTIAVTVHLDQLKPHQSIPQEGSICVGDIQHSFNLSKNTKVQFISQLQNFDGAKLKLEGNNQEHIEFGHLEMKNHRIYLICQPGWIDTWNRFRFQYVENGPDLKMDIMLASTTSH